MKLPDGACELHGVGTSCKDESKMGAELRDVGPSRIACKFWIHERETRQEALVIHENTVAFDAWRISDVLADTHRIYTVMLCPSQLGYPMRRPRRLTVCVRKDYVLTLLLAEFLNAMGRRPAAPLGVYFCLDETTPEHSKYIEAEKRGVARKSQQRQLFAG